MKSYIGMSIRIIMILLLRSSSRYEMVVTSFPLVTPTTSSIMTQQQQQQQRQQQQQQHLINHDSKLTSDLSAQSNRNKNMKRWPNIQGTENHSHFDWSIQSITATSRRTTEEVPNQPPIENQTPESHPSGENENGSDDDPNHTGGNTNNDSATENEEDEDDDDDGDGDDTADAASKLKESEPDLMNENGAGHSEGNEESNNNVPLLPKNENNEAIPTDPNDSKSENNDNNNTDEKKHDDATKNETDSKEVKKEEKGETPPENNNSNKTPSNESDEKNVPLVSDVTGKEQAIDNPPINNPNLNDDEDDEFPWLVVVLGILFGTVTLYIVVRFLRSKITSSGRTDYSKSYTNPIQYQGV
jgi:hypothetical protein